MRALSTVGIHMANPSVLNDDGIDPDRYEVEPSAEIIGDVVLWAEEPETQPAEGD